MKSTGIAGTIPKEADSNLVGSSYLSGKGSATSNRYSGADNAISTQYTNVHISDVHCASLTFAITGLLAI